MSAIATKWVSGLTIGNTTAKHLLLFLSVHNFHKPGFFFKLETIANQLEISVRAVQKAFLRLEKRKLIVKEYRFDEKTGRQTTNGYYLNIPQEFVDNYFNEQGEGERGSPLGVNVVQGEGERGSGGGTKKQSFLKEKSNTCKKSARPNSNINNKLNNNISCPSDDGRYRFFCSFWEIYPRKEKKKRSLEIWTKNKLESLGETIIKSLKTRLDSDWRDKDKKFIPLPDKFLNDERWTDEIGQTVLSKIDMDKMDIEEKKQVIPLASQSVVSENMHKIKEILHGKRTISGSDADKSRGPGVRKIAYYIL